MIPSVDTYLRSEIESKMKIILENRYIIDEILKGIQPKVKENFIKTYTGEKAKEIPIVYTMPQERVLKSGAIYIGLKEGREEHPSMGNLESTYDFKTDGLIKEESVIQVEEVEDGYRLFFEVEHNIAELNNVENLEFSRSDNVEIEGNRIYFAYQPELIGMRFKVNYYSSSTNVEEQGLRKGFSSLEYYSVLAVSTNMDTVRCLDLILKAIFILMRDNASEQTNLLLQKIQFGQIEEMDIGTEQTPEIVYGRETIVGYTVTYSLDAPLLNTLEEFLIKVKLETREEKG